MTDNNNDNVVRDFMARRYAVIYCDLYLKENKQAAENWVKQKINLEDIYVLRPYVEKEFEKRGIKIKGE